MGNIITPTPGDLVDRQTILQIKLKHCGTSGDTGMQPVSAEMLEQSPAKSVSRTKLLEKTEIDIQPLLIEHQAIQDRLMRDWFPKILNSVGEQKFDPLLERLLHINEELWRLEDQARVLRAAPEKFLDSVVRRKAETLDAISTCNDMRMQVVREINSLWDIQSEEKIYA